MPHGQLALLAPDVEQGGGQVGLPVAVQERHQRMGGPIGVPERPRGVGRVVGVVHCAVGAAIVAVHVAEQRGGGHRVEKRRVEDAQGRGLPGAGRCGGALDYRDPAQRRLPLGVGLVGHALEVPVAELGLQVGLRPCLAHGGDAHAQQQRTAVVGKGHDGQRVALAAEGADGLRRLGHIEDLLVAGPSAREAMAADGRGVLPHGLATGEAVPADAALQVEPQVEAVGSRRTGVAMQASAHRGRQLHADAALEPHGVVARASLLVGMAEPGLCLAGLHHGQHADVAQVADARSAEVQMAEPHEHGVAVVVARTPVPPMRMLRGPQLHQSERHVGPNEHMAVATRSDERMHQPGISSCHQRARCQSHHQAQRRRHFLSSHRLVHVFVVKIASSAPICPDGITASGGLFRDYSYYAFA